MDVMEAIAKRQSVRRYLDKEIPLELLDELLEAARLAPSASNKQDWKFVVVRDSAIREQVAGAAGQPFIGTAPVIVAGVSINPGRIMSCDVPAYAVDLAIAMTNITLLATARGLGTCWIGAFDQKRVKQILGIPPEFKVVQLMPVGYPDDSPRPKMRKSKDEIVSFDRY
jgi:nitroreductase